MEVEPNFTTERAQRDYQLVCKARDNGDESAFAALMSSYRQPIYLMLLKMTKNPTIADDLTIEVFGKAFCSLKSYAPVRPFSSWLFSIASNNGIDFIRRKKETLYIDDITVMDGDDEYDYQLPSDIGNPEEEFEREQRKQVLRTVVGQLRPKYRQMIELRYFEELSYDEISKRLNMPPGTVRINLFRAHEVLQSIMRQKKDII